MGEKMREIKFRVWDEDRKEYVRSDENSYALGLGFYQPDGIYSSNVSIYMSLNSVVEQFTGLKDSKGQDIYEGDLLSAPDTPWYKGLESKVIFDNGMFEAKYKGSNSGSLIDLLDKYGTHVIGNIHEPLPESPADWVKRHEK